MNPVDHPAPFETVRIAGVVAPGTATISGLAYEFEWDVKNAAGSNGAGLSGKGRKLSDFSIKFSLIRDLSQDIDQFSQWYDDFLPLLKSCFVGKDYVGLTLEHPDAQALEVDAVVVKKIGNLVLDGEGGATVDVSFIQWAPAKKASTSGPSRTRHGVGIDPDDPIEQRRETIKELSGGP